MNLKQFTETGYITRRITSTTTIANLTLRRYCRFKTFGNWERSSKVCKNNNGHTYLYNKMNFTTKIPYKEI